MEFKICNCILSNFQTEIKTKCSNSKVSISFLFETSMEKFNFYVVTNLYFQNSQFESDLFAFPFRCETLYINNVFS